MNWTEESIRAIVTDMTAEDPLACQALLGIAEIEFTWQVPTMAITLSSHPILKINLDFCCKHLQSENDVKCVLLHEFLHVLLDHNLQYQRMTPLLNIALDAIINAVIHRLKGRAYSDFFLRFYEWKSVTMLLRPMLDVSREKHSSVPAEQMNLHKRIYRGELGAEDLLEILENTREICSQIGNIKVIPVLGNHSSRKVSAKGKAIMDAIAKRTEGMPVWSKGFLKSDHRDPAERKDIKKFQLDRWRKITMELIRKCIIPDRYARPEKIESEFMLPVLSQTDRRASLRYLSGGIIPFSRHSALLPEPTARCVVYLDVSGSMNKEIQQLISLLHQLRDHLQQPFYSFADVVGPARFSGGKVIIRSSGGTRIDIVFEHMRKNQFKKALIVTDGYFDTISDADLKGIQRRDIHFLISVAGNTSKVAEKGLDYRQLPELPK